MRDNNGSVKNPLTIVAIFASVAEISGTAVLPFVDSSHQEIYIWFLVIFPVLLVLVFFVTLNLNHQVLYAPSDFKDEDNFFKRVRNASPTERDEKIRGEVRDAEGVVAEPSAISADNDALQKSVNVEGVVGVGSTGPHVRDVTARYMQAEKLILNRLAMEMSGIFRKNVKMKVSDGYLLFDSLNYGNNHVTAIEVKYVSRLFLRPMAQSVRRLVDRISDSRKNIPMIDDGAFSLLVAVATDLPARNHDAIIQAIKKEVGDPPFPVHVRVFKMEELQREQDAAALTSS